ncbi:MAG: formimidoylglutamate deiminase [Paracoccaceae bacterium]
MSRGFYLKKAFTGKTWLHGLSVHIDGDGLITGTTQDDNPDALPSIAGPVVPGITNLHSHAFQYAMAGLTEARHDPVDTFWSWRQMMYHFALRLTPEDQTAVAAKLYLECLKHGFTGVAEFHYIHNAPDGSRYACAEEMSLATLRAAKLSGIQLTLMPVFYAHSDFGGQPPTDAQRRFVTSLDGFARMLEDLSAPCREQGVVLGLAPHSLRAVSEDELATLSELHAALAPNAPIHIHVAEQMAEVEASLAFSGQRPVERLFDLAEVNQNWCLIHATHMTAEETANVARSGATVGLCPLTEANLGDGDFNGRDYLENGGYFGIGTDSNVCTDPFAELQMLEYSQRLTRHQRTVLASSEHPGTGQNLVANAAIGGGRATGRATGMIAPGYCADFVELTEDQSGAYDRLSDDAILDYRVFAQGTRAVGQVVIGGNIVLAAGRHAEEEKINQAFRKSMDRLCRDL